MRISKGIAAILLGFFSISSANGGGSGSSSGSGAEACVERGAETVTHMGPSAHPAANGTFPLRIVVNANTVTIGHCTNDETVTLASDGSFTLTLKRSFWDELGRLCFLLTTYTGKVEGTLVTGTVSSDGPCVYKHGSLSPPHTTTGTFTSAP